MIPVMCRVKHDPENGTYGDCVRACIASIMEMDGDDVPHFYADSCDGETAHRRITHWMMQHKVAPFYAQYPGAAQCAEVLEMMGKQNPTVHYILFGRSDDADHVVVCRGGTIVHDPSWFPSPLIGCASNGYWSVLVIAKA